MTTIMIVDDYQDIVETTKKIVKKLGYTSIEAANGKEFLTKIKKKTPDLVLLDVMMPGLTTKEILEELKKLKQQHLKIILLTVVRFAEEEKKALLGMPNIVDYITKPYDVEDLMKRIQKQIK